MHAINLQKNTSDYDFDWGWFTDLIANATQRPRTSDDDRLDSPTGTDSHQVDGGEDGGDLGLPGGQPGRNQTGGVPAHQLSGAEAQGVPHNSDRRSNHSSSVTVSSTPSDHPDAALLQTDDDAEVGGDGVFIHEPLPARTDTRLAAQPPPPQCHQPAPQVRQAGTYPVKDLCGQDVTDRNKVIQKK